MKVQIDFMDNGIPLLEQMLAVDAYINEYGTTKTEDLGYIDKVSHIIKETPKNTGYKVETENGKRFHVSCSRTQSGMYKFNVWMAA